MQELERVEAQELNTTEEKTEVYTDSIQESIANYCIDHDMESFARTVDVVFIIFTSWRVKSPGSIPCTIK